MIDGWMKAMTSEIDTLSSHVETSGCTANAIASLQKGYGNSPLSSFIRSASTRGSCSENEKFQPH